MTARRHLTWLGALLLGAHGRTATANPADVFGLGARGAAMAGAQTAIVDDTTAGYYNPARLGGLRDIHIDVGYQLGLPRLSTGAEPMTVEPSAGTVIGLAVPGQLGDSRMTFGATLFVPDQHITRTRALAPNRPRFLAYDNRPQRLLVAANVGIELTPGLSIGGGLAFMAGTQGTVWLRGLVGFPDAEASDLDLAIDVSLKTNRYPHLGVAWQPNPWLSLGVTYRGAFNLSIDQTFDIRGNVGGIGQPPIVEDGFFYLRSASQDLFQPEQVVLGAAAQVTPAWLVALDLGYHRWSSFRHPAAVIELALDVGQFNDLVMLPPPVPLPAPNLHDVIVPRLGVEYAPPAKRWTLRGGYALEPAVAGEQRGETNFLDNTKHTLSLGGGWTVAGLGEIVPKPLELDVFAAMTYLAPRTHRKDDPLDPIGDLRASGHAFSMGVTSRWRF